MICNICKEYECNHSMFEKELFEENELIKGKISQQSQLIDKCLEVAEFYGSKQSWSAPFIELGKVYSPISRRDNDCDTGHLRDSYGGKKARELLISDEIKKYRENI